MATLPLHDIQGLVLRGYGMNALSVFVLAGRSRRRRATGARRADRDERDAMGGKTRRLREHRVHL